MAINLEKNNVSPKFLRSFPATATTVVINSYITDPSIQFPYNKNILLILSNIHDIETTKTLKLLSVLSNVSQRDQITFKSYRVQDRGALKKQRNLRKIIVGSLFAYVEIAETVRRGPPVK